MYPEERAPIGRRNTKKNDLKRSIVIRIAPYGSCAAAVPPFSPASASHWPELQRPFRTGSVHRRHAGGQAAGLADRERRRPGRQAW